MIMNKFASAIIMAAKIREDSYDRKAADKASKGPRLIVDYNKFYQKDLYEAAEEAVKKVGLNTEMVQPIYLLLSYTWNDALEWAESI